MFTLKMLGDPVLLQARLGQSLARVKIWGASTP